MGAWAWGDNSTGMVYFFACPWHCHGGSTVQPACLFRLVAFFLSEDEPRLKNEACAVKARRALPALRV